MLPNINICKNCSFLSYIYKIRCGNVSNNKYPFCQKIKTFLDEYYVYFDCGKEVI